MDETNKKITYVFCPKCGKRMEDVDMPMCWECYYKQDEEEVKDG